MEPEAGRSVAAFYYYALGLKYAFALPFLGLIGFILTAIVTSTARRTAVGATVLFTVAIPIFIGGFATVDGLIESFMVIAASTTSPKPSELSQGMQMSLVSLWVGLWLSVPSYLLAAGGMVVRSLTAANPPASK